MPTFVPVYRPKPSQQTFLDREQRRERKRKRDRESEGGLQFRDDSPDSADGNTARPAHPISLTDPYYVAGHSREEPLPGGNFPHADPDEIKQPELSLETELANVKPPLFVPRIDPDNHADSLRRRHIDNLTAILHKCMLNGDWTRASRVWGLLLRTEMDGRPMDVRRHGRWTTSAELLMRRDHEAERRPRDGTRQHIDDGSSITSGTAISDLGFKLAREFYERLILQYPHRPIASRTSINALAIYPALFNVWIYEVQDRSKRARELLESSPESAFSDEASVDESKESINTEEIRQVRERELAEAQSILERLDDVLSAPPFDASQAILQYRGFVGAWISDLHAELAESYAAIVDVAQPDGEDLSSLSLEDPRSVAKRHRKQARSQRTKGKEVFQRMASLGMILSDDVVDFMDEKESPGKRDDSDDN